MTEVEPTTIRLRHFTRRSSKARSLVEEHLLARDQNIVFVERADREPLSPREVEARYLLKRGRGNAYVEFDARPEEVYEQVNRLTGGTEFFRRGNVNLSWRNPQGFDNY